MIPPDDLLTMFADRAHHPSRAVIEAVLLTAALDRLDDFCTALAVHVETDHPGDGAGITICQTLDAVQARIRREQRTVESALAHVREEPAP
jgi:hypothetical protein